MNAAKSVVLSLRRHRLKEEEARGRKEEESATDKRRPDRSRRAVIRQNEARGTERKWKMA